MANVSRGRVYNEGGHILKQGDIVAVKMVAVIGWAEDFSVYQGLSEWSDQQVAENGDKVPESVGRAVAPYCAHLAYRW